MELEQALKKLDEYSIDRIKTLLFNLENNVFFTYELQPSFHDSMIKACKIKIEGANHE